MNTKFGKLIGQKLIYAPLSGKIGNILYSKLSEEQLRELGYKKIVNNVPEPKDGYVARFIKYEQDEDNIYLIYDLIESSQHEKKFEISKVYFKIALIKIGLWDTFNEWMESSTIDLGDGKTMTVKDAWDESLVLDPNSDLFKPYIAEAKEAFSAYISSEQIDQLFEECRAK